MASLRPAYPPAPAGVSGGDVDLTDVQIGDVEPWDLGPEAHALLEAGRTDLGPTPADLARVWEKVRRALRQDAAQKQWLPPG